jgi:hypothetical protein
VQDLARFDGCGGRVSVDELGKRCAEVTGKLDPDLDSITPTYGCAGLLNLPTQMQCDPVRGLGRAQRSSLGRATLE